MASLGQIKYFGKLCYRKGISPTRVNAIFEQIGLENPKAVKPGEAQGAVARLSTRDASRVIALVKEESTAG